MNAKETLDMDMKFISAYMAVTHALEYLKGRNVPNMGIFTADLIDGESELEQLAISQMVMERRTAVSEGNPMLVQITPAESNYGEMSGRTQCAEPNLSNTPKGLDDEPTPPRC